ncbi:MAG: hypothetical protein CMM52_10505 [Rhodospirillaceae bacterium]|nr:hypothetical protein [Rhodospirillaceae bacterium]|tara:strand:+ start:386 stop:1729 length:1344 start_codon:yes stop_codon:yes gene_type:complete
MTSRFIRAVAALAVPISVAATPVYAADKQDLNRILGEIQALKKAYENRIATLENKIKSLEQKKAVTGKKATPASAGKSIKDNSFNPSLGIVLNGRASTYSENSSEIAGFGIGEEGERGREGLAIDESEINFSANVDDKFYASSTVAIVREEGEDKVELEEAYLQTLPDAGLPDGLRIKAGRAFWTLGYLNEHHAHADDFADRPLPYRAFLNKAFNDDGVEISYVVPADLFIEFGGGVFRGDDFPAGDSVSGLGAWSAYGRIGGDIGDNQSWRLGAYTLHTDVNGRSTNEGNVNFIGKSNLYAADLRYTWAPTGNAKNSELILQAEYFNRNEEGTYSDSEASTGNVNFDDSSQGWYAQAVYKFAPSWRIGARYSQLLAADTPAGLTGSALDSAGHDPYTMSVMGDWTNSEFGRIRVQYNREELSDGREDNQFILQYIMSIGAHSAHAF